MRLISQSRFCSPRQPSKTAIRRSKQFTKQRISKSLNFETGRNDKFKTPSSGGLDQFSRSAKIMRALNFNSCPGNNSKRKSVTKVLNFDVSPSPKSLQSPASNFSASSPIDSIHLSISSSDSHSTSIDENQNRTPSNPRKSAKKSLDYLTPQSKRSNSSSSNISISPALRSDLREQIDNLIQIGETPNAHSMKRNLNKSAVPNDIVNTSRNLYFDFERECSDSSPCPSTPTNTCKPIPESMSAIKKSHRKERLSRRFEDKEPNGRILDDDDEGMHLLEPEELVASPSITQHSTPNNRAKLANKSCVLKDDEDNENTDCDEEDNLSETGSLFSYSRDKENIDEQLDEPVPLDAQKEPEVMAESIPGSPAKPVDSTSYLETPKRESKSVLKASKVVNANALSPIKLVAEFPIVPMGNSTPLVRRNLNAHTPENVPSAIPNIIGSSIKKSHRKVKAENRKRLIKPTTLHAALLNSSRDIRLRAENNAESTNADSRPTTPENLNSSRLLLPQFDSVKRSHKKEKQTKMLEGFARRSMLLDHEHLSTSTRSNLSNVSMSLKNLLDDDNNDDDNRDSPIKHKSDSFSEIVPIEHLDENTSSPTKKMKTPEGETVIKANQSTGSNSEFQIFTPFRKRRPQLIPADEPVQSIARNVTVDDGFVTPVKSKVLPPVAVEDITPEDRLSTAELVKDIEHSIKKSHRKDKLATRQKLNRLNRSLNTSFNESLRPSGIENPQPSTSRASNDTTPTITPPNCLKTKSYLHLLQNSSIKKSHKLERGKRKSLVELNRSINDVMNKRAQTKESKSMEDSTLSDDGSIFSEEDRISFLESEGAINNEDKMDEDGNLNENSLNERNPTSKDENKCSDLDQSYQGSIFDESERLQNIDDEEI